MASPDPLVVLPTDLIRDILARLGTMDLLQPCRVCLTWRSTFCNNRGLWTTIEMEIDDPNDELDAGVHEALDILCRKVIEHSDGGCTEFTLRGTGNLGPVNFQTSSCTGVRVLRLEGFRSNLCDEVFYCLDRLMNLFELEINGAVPNEGMFHKLRRFCPNLRILKLNNVPLDLIASADRLCSSIASIDYLEEIEIQGLRLSTTGLSDIFKSLTGVRKIDLRQCGELVIDIPDAEYFQHILDTRTNAIVLYP